jgi:hypothetical protein
LIPRIIHQIWLNPPLPEQYRAWREQLIALHPGWEVRLWTAENLPDYDQVMDLYDLRGYHPTIASDVFRVLVVLKYGGFYLDCDTEPIACLESLREHSIVCRYDGWIQVFAASELRINSGHGFGAEAGSPILAAYMDRCDAMRGSPETVLYRVGFLGLSEHLWGRREEITLLTKADLETYYRHEAKMEWIRPGGNDYRPIFEAKPLVEPFKKKQARPWPTAEEMLRSNRGTNTGCCSRPSNREIKR